ncbi:PEP-CTERM sorting domain-containing protein [Methylococcus sp. EFPC2]|uniref:PEP-CTERM sorting domain-containing protein n=1 Tax=Methylococcus sp. EFPC2 TaxID=2812648 RepID=UPI001967BF0E|nr:PEP-CTERM sorting domain-containing protein [Methylococcus sp. EFPC2]QSA97902.1 PEP-CTERM sorting domain-containing protein [Methylococcus sp. EFPC2]
MYMRFPYWIRFVFWIFLSVPASAGAVPIVFSVSGADAATIQSTVDGFRAALGGPNNGNAPGPLGSGRREINWDGGGGNFTTTSAAMPFNVFLNTRGAQFITPGTGLIQAPPAADAGTFPPGGLAGLFGNPTYGSIFTTFSDERLFTPVGSNVTDGLFFLPGTNGAVAATVSAFGLVFADVDLADTTSIQFFDPNGNSLGIFFADSFNNGLSFLGVRFSNEAISRVRIFTGNSALGPNDGGGVDVVVMDDFIYAEPRALQAVPEPATGLLLSAGLAGFGWKRTRPRRPDAA